ncbi:hypothetical protein TH61_08515 [Rufibacter sp. DG15C]|uniref:hypothetical protein n=1 Tax=Rufibacter sp. DG15C TaxID=1379909 RepID=UPI00078CB29E|nr:hypothetical protein [Rufibacter sp. DG15C]AMM51210.1 hypothetical protein TH61_08515 [Rufibacter sp. DG15C]
MLDYKPVLHPNKNPNLYPQQAVATVEQRQVNAKSTPSQRQGQREDNDESTLNQHEIIDRSTLSQHLLPSDNLSHSNLGDIWVKKFKPLIDLINLNSSRRIVRTPPIVKLNGEGLIWQRTINIIQGKFGSHKSRLAELICSLLIRSNNCDTDFCGLAKDEFKQFSVAYVDTERNTSEQFPLAIQQVRNLAGRDQYQPYDYLIPFSLIHYNRNERLPAIKEFIEQLMIQCDRHKFVLLDVVTDCIKDFNNSSESLELFDFLNQLINDHDITLLLIIHENPGTDKARGHIGTEAANKASTIMQIGFEKGANNRDSDVIAVKLLKLRNGKKPDPTYLYFDATTHALAPASPEMVNEMIEDRRKKLDVSLLTDCLGNYLMKPKLQQDLISELTEKYSTHANTVKTRLKEIAEKDLVIYSCEGLPCYLRINSRPGIATTYELLVVGEAG